MTRHGYMVLLLRVSVPNRPRDLQRMNAVGDNSDDLLANVKTVISNLGTGYHQEDKTGDGYRFRHVVEQGRAIHLRVHKGPEGGVGEAYHLDTEESIETGDRQALLSGLRTSIFLPKDSYYGLLFVERAGRRNLRDLIKYQVLRPAGHASHALVRPESFAESDDWRVELEGREVLRVSQLLSITEQDSASDASTLVDTKVEVITEGGKVRRASSAIKDHVLDRIGRRERSFDIQTDVAKLREKKRASTNAFSVAEQGELQALEDELVGLRTGEPDIELLQGLADVTPSLAGGEVTHRQFEVSLGTQRPERSFLVERDSVPQFVYSLGSRLSDEALFAAWTVHAETILTHRGVVLPDGWAG